MGQQSPALITSPSGLKVRPNQHPVPNEAAPFPREMVCSINFIYLLLAVNKTYRHFNLYIDNT